MQLANYSVAYEETQSNRVSDFRDFCVLRFQRQSFLTFIIQSYLSEVTRFFSELLCSFMADSLHFTSYLSEVTGFFS